MERYKLAVLEENPIHYRTPIYKKLTKNHKIDLKVYFCNDISNSGFFDRETGKRLKFNSDLEGFDSKFLKNYWPKIKKDKNIRKGLLNLGIIKELIKEKYDAIIMYGYNSNTHKIATIFSKLIGIPVIFREEIDEIRGGKMKKLLKKIIYRIWFKLPNAFLCSYTKNRNFYKKFGIPEEKLFMHPCAVDNDYFQQKAKNLKKEKIKKELGLKKSSKVILFVGKLSERKRPYNLFNAFKSLEDKNTVLIYAGTGYEQEKIKKECEKENIKNVIFTGFINRENLIKYYSIADLFIIASDYDPSPKVLNEAMNFSLPVIVSDKVGTAQDLVKQGKNGFVFECGNTKELSKYIQKLINSKKLRESMGKESLKIVSKWNFDEDVKATIKALDYIYKNKKPNKNKKEKRKWEKMKTI